MTPGSSTLLLSDFHAGHHHTRHRDRKFRALDAIMDHVRAFDVSEIVLAGDIADERPDRLRVQEECAMLREAMQGHSTVFLRGNHDAASYFEKSEMEELLCCAVDERPWHVSPHTGVVITHGHHFRTPAFRKALRKATHEEQLAGLCSAERAERHLRTVTKSLSVVGRMSVSVESYTGFPATGLWEQFQQVSQKSRSRAATSLRRKQLPLPAKRGWYGAVADIIDLRSIRHAARLARTTNSWGAVAGHTHVPGIYKHHVKDRATGERIPFLVGNSGSFVSRYAPTCIEVRYPRMTLWQYDEATNAMVVAQEMELTAEELAVQARFFQCG